MRPSESWDPSCCWVGSYAISQWVCVLAFISWPLKMRVTRCWEIAQSPTPLLPTDFSTGHGINGEYFMRLVQRFPEAIGWVKSLCLILTEMLQLCNIHHGSFTLAFVSICLIFSKMAKLVNTLAYVPPQYQYLLHRDMKTSQDPET